MSKINGTSIGISFIIGMISFVIYVILIKGTAYIIK